ncbi:hypothetical protein ACJDU8_22795 [Clostridium sp. WILCCON 0269]|uniref:Uncharacterized protein n=1 Tax=Candidatus Clostridium eludens TaxID=3381663 RepID=A0ABW8ST82_9CLOT
MDFAGKNFVVICKIILALVIVFTLIRIIPLLAMTAAILFLFLTVKKYFKNKRKHIFKSENKENIEKDREEPFNSQYKKIIDVDYSEVKKSSDS